LKIGAHCVLFRERITTETTEILTGLAKAGYEGFEMGARFFGVDDKAKLTYALDKSGIELSGLHFGAPFGEFVTNKDTVSQNLLNAAKFLQGLPNKNIIMSSSGFDEVDNIEAAKNINDMALRCGEFGVTINYHNHAGEFENNMAVFKTLVDNAPALKFALDLGWIYAAGLDPAAIVKQYRSKVDYVHLRDTKNRSREGFTEMGEGIFNYPSLMPVLQDALGDNGWAVVEYEDGEQDIQRYIHARAFLRGLGY